MKNNLSEKETERYSQQLFGLEYDKLNQAQAVALKNTFFAAASEYLKMFPTPQQQQTELEKLLELMRTNNPLPANFLRLFTEKLAAVQSLAPLYDNLIQKVNAINSGVTHAHNHNDHDDAAHAHRTPFSFNPFKKAP